MSVAGTLTRDGWLLFATRCSRMFAFGLLSVVLVLYLVEVGLKEWEVGLLLTLTLAGDTAISLPRHLARRLDPQLAQIGGDSGADVRDAFQPGDVVPTGVSFRGFPLPD